MPEKTTRDPSLIAIRVFLVMMAVFLVFCLVSFVIMQYQMAQAQKQKELLQQRLEEKEELLLELKWDAAHAMDEATLRKWLRLHGYCEPGDIFGVEP